jgi:hypothetical protein
MTKHALKQIVIASFSSIILACAAVSEPSTQAAFEDDSRGRDCIWQSSIRDYQVLDDSNLIVTGGVKRNYHVVLSRRAFGLRSTWQIGFRSPTGRVCGNTAELIVGDGMGTERIQIRSIRELNPDDLDDLLVRFGKKEPEFEQTPAAEEVEGAEVEELD